MSSHKVPTAHDVPAAVSRRNHLLKAIAALSAIVAPFAEAALQDANSAANNANADPTLSTVIVTASRVEETIADSLASTTVLDRHDIETLQAKNFTDLIAHVPSVDLSTSGAPGSASNLFLRGTNSAHTLFLIDGQRVSSATTGATSFQFLDPSQIERIEVVRGPKSSLYGSDAIGGVIQIFTRQAQEQTSAYASAGAGGYDTYQASAGGQTHYEQWRLSASVSHYKTEGFSSYDSKESNLGDNDSYRNTSLSANAGYDFANGATFDLNHFYTVTRNDYDDSYSPDDEPYYKSWLQSTRATLKIPVLSFWKMSLAAGRSIDDSDNFSSFSSNFRTTHKTASWQNDFTLAKAHVLTAGIDYDKDNIDASTIYEKPDGKAVDSRDNKGVFLQYLGDFGAIDTQLGIRSDDNEDFGHQTTGNAALGFKLPQNHKVILSYGTAFHAPTFNDLYYPGFGNAELKPEFSKNYEIEVRGDYSTFNWSASVFQNNVTDLIQNVIFDPVNDLSMPENVAKARIRGVEFIAGAKLYDWLINGSLTYTDPRDRETDNILAYRSRRSAKIDADRTFGNWSVGASFHVQDERYADSDNTARLGGYGLFDLRGGYNFSKNLDVQLKLTNIFNKKYELNNNYNTERFSWFTTITYRM